MNSNPRALISVGIIYKIEINFPYLSKDVSRMQIWKRNTFQEASNVFSMMTEFQESSLKLYTYIYIYILDKVLLEYIHYNSNRQHI